MATNTDLILLQGNTETLSGTVTSGGSAYNLTGITLEMLIKPSAAVSDSDSTVTTLSTATGEISVVSAAGGTYSVSVPAAQVASSGQKWYRVDAVSGSVRRTVVYGPLVIEDM